MVLAPAHREPDLVDERPTPTAPAVPAPGTHRVAAGETLYRIARSLGITPGALAEMNGVAVSAPLVVGQVLIVPAPAGRSAPPSASAVQAPGGTADPSTTPAVLPPALAAAFEAAGGPSPASPPASGARSAAGSAATGPSRPTPDDAGSAEHATPVARRDARGPGRTESSVLGAVLSSSQGRPSAAPRRSSVELQWPLRGVLYARFGRKGKSPHDGIDLSAPAGTPVRTAGEGTVLFAGPQQGYGLLVIIEHVHGLVTVYAHNRDLRVKTGQTVREGQVIATVGESGKTSGPHLHFEVRQDGAPVDPLGFLGPPPSA